MIKQLAWNLFKNTGDINSYLEYAQIENEEKKSQVDIQGNVLLTEEKNKPNFGVNIGANNNGNN